MIAWKVNVALACAKILSITHEGMLNTFLQCGFTLRPPSTHEAPRWIGGDLVRKLFFEWSGHSQSTILSLMRISSVSQLVSFGPTFKFGLLPAIRPSRSRVPSGVEPNLYNAFTKNDSFYR